MYNNDFLKLHSLEGELKLSHKKRDFGITVSTKELVYQKPHVNYIVPLDRIVTITPFRESRKPGERRGWQGLPTAELSGLSIGNHHYRIYALEAVIHSRSGIHPLGATEFILPMTVELLEAVSRYGGLSGIKS